MYVFLVIGRYVVYQGCEVSRSEKLVHEAEKLRTTAVSVTGTADRILFSFIARRYCNAQNLLLGCTDKRSFIFRLCIGSTKARPQFF